MSLAFMVQQMTISIRLLAIACFVCAQVKVEHPVFRKMFITKEKHSFSQFHSDKFKVQWSPMSHFVRELANLFKHWPVNLQFSMSDVVNTTLDSTNGILRGTGVLALVNSHHVSCIIMHHLTSHSSPLMSPEFKPRLM